MPVVKPAVLRTVVFIDGENLRKTCYRVFEWGYCHPQKLAAELVATQPDRELTQCRLYTGVPNPNVESKRAGKVTRRLNAYEDAGTHVVRRPLLYFDEWVIQNPPETTTATATAVVSGTGTASSSGSVSVQAEMLKVGHEKGIDTRLALDLIRLAIDNIYDLAVVVSGDSDIDEAVKEVIDLRPYLGRWITLENAVPRVEGKKYVHLKSCPRNTHIDEAMFKKVSDNNIY
jgi:uncharacterized LabA/DUF88 family protein